jgi:hypothetical protein
MPQSREPYPYHVMSDSEQKRVEALLIHPCVLLSITEINHLQAVFIRRDDEGDSKGMEHLLIQVNQQERIVISWPRHSISSPISPTPKLLLHKFMVQRKERDNGFALIS